VEFVDGSSRRIHFFASRLKYSRLVRVSLVQDEERRPLEISLVGLGAMLVLSGGAVGNLLRTWLVTRRPR
jgi:hypothetical protein